MRILTAALACSLISGTALAQGRPPKHFDFYVLPEVVQVAGDTTELGYAFVNTAASRDSVWIVTLDAPSPVLSMSAPSGNEYYLLRRYGDRSVASWGFLKDLQPPGTRLEGYRMRAIGLPGIVPYWVRRELVPDTVDDEMEPPAKIDRKAPPPVNADTDTGSTVGIVPFPADRSSAALAIRLGDLLGRACAMNWIDSPGVCTSLLTKIRNGAWEAMRHELDAQREKHVSPRAYYLLRGNLDVLLGATPRRG